MPATPKLKRIVVACLVAAAICGVGYLMFLENIHGGSVFSRTMLQVMFPTISLAFKYNLLFGSVGLLLVLLVSAYVLWAAVIYLFLSLLQAYDDV